VVIVTQNQYLLASKIHHITMDENVNYIDAKTQSGRNISIRDVHFTITVIYSPELVQTSNSGTLRNQEEQRECTVVIRGAVNAHKVFKDIVEQIREQMPDQLYLDTALERMISGVDVSALALKDEDDKKDDLAGLFTTLNQIKRSLNDRSTKKVRKPGKTKRTSKKVLRRAKRSC